MSPLPSALYRRLRKEGRIVGRHWAYYDNVHFRHLPVFEPRNMSRETSQAGCQHADRITYAPANVLRRLRKSGAFQPPIWIANYILMRTARQVPGAPARAGARTVSGTRVTINPSLALPARIAGHRPKAALGVRIRAPRGACRAQPGRSRGRDSRGSASAGTRRSLTPGPRSVG